ncbi:putative cullin-associated NEDD8-dissociated protein 1 [Blattamonas nauphoetae]|uniref:Cullin-associated NEDD8-dissociated protein 1 n=1 Tax=Blattamonas nauphoetae TaxID=2049346 RepID=A0ABQ9YK68_9EUKA|nr:putative cullin-associated NEDD8-dissociated protein 1 [Blattamonas nauphoetae]
MRDYDPDVKEQGFIDLAHALQKPDCNFGLKDTTITNLVLAHSVEHNRLQSHSENCLKLITKLDLSSQLGKEIINFYLDQIDKIVKPEERAHAFSCFNIFLANSDKQFQGIITKTVFTALMKYVSVPDLEPFCLDLLTTISDRYGSHLEKKQSDLMLLFIHEIDSPIPSIRQKATNGLTMLSPHLTPPNLKEFVSTVLNSLTGNVNDSQQQQKMKLLAKIVMKCGSSVKPFLSQLIPLFLNSIPKLKDERSADDLRATLLQSLCSIVLSLSPVDTADWFEGIVQNALNSLKYDPVYADDEEEEEEEEEEVTQMQVDLEEEEEEEEEDEPDEEEDDDEDAHDLSWTVRREAAKLLSAFIKNERLGLFEIYQFVLPTAIKRLTEHTDQCLQLVIEMINSIITLTREYSLSPDDTSSAKLLKLFPKLISQAQARFACKNQETRAKLMSMLSSLSFIYVRNGGCPAQLPKLIRSLNSQLSSTKAISQPLILAIFALLSDLIASNPAAVIDKNLGLFVEVITTSSKQSESLVIENGLRIIDQLCSAVSFGVHAPMDTYLHRLFKMCLAVMGSSDVYSMQKKNASLQSIGGILAVFSTHLPQQDQLTLWNCLVDHVHLETLRVSATVGLSRFLSSASDLSYAPISLIVSTFENLISSLKRHQVPQLGTNSLNGLSACVRLFNNALPPQLLESFLDVLDDLTQIVQNTHLHIAALNALGNLLVFIPSIFPTFDKKLTTRLLLLIRNPAMTVQQAQSLGRLFCTMISTGLDVRTVLASLMSLQTDHQSQYDVDVATLILHIVLEQCDESVRNETIQSLYVLLMVDGGDSLDSATDGLKRMKVSKQTTSQTYIFCMSALSTIGSTTDLVALLPKIADSLQSFFDEEHNVAFKAAKCLGSLAGGSPATLLELILSKAKAKGPQQVFYVLALSEFVRHLSEIQTDSFSDSRSPSPGPSLDTTPTPVPAASTTAVDFTKSNANLILDILIQVLDSEELEMRESAIESLARLIKGAPNKTLSRLARIVNANKPHNYTQINLTTTNATPTSKKRKGKFASSSKIEKQEATAPVEKIYSLEWTVTASIIAALRVSLSIEGDFLDFGDETGTTLAGSSGSLISSLTLLNQQSVPSFEQALMKFMPVFLTTLTSNHVKEIEQCIHFLKMLCLKAPAISRSFIHNSAPDVIRYLSPINSLRRVIAVGMIRIHVDDAQPLRLASISALTAFMIHFPTVLDSQLLFTHTMKCCNDVDIQDVRMQGMVLLERMCEVFPTTVINELAQVSEMLDLAVFPKTNIVTQEQDQQNLMKEAFILTKQISNMKGSSHSEGFVTLLRKIQDDNEKQNAYILETKE